MIYVYIDFLTQGSQWYEKGLFKQMFTNPNFPLSNLENLTATIFPSLETPKRGSYYEKEY